VTTPASLATLPVVRALLDEARRKQYATGTLGIHARPQWPGSDTFEHQGVPVTVVPCGSTLAVREALRQRRDDRWLVILTDRDDTDLGAGVRSHLLWHRLRTPDPWAAVLGRFAATGLDPALTTGSGRRDLAVGLLACTPAEGGWVPAPGGVLTRDHALGSVARRYLRLPMAELDPGAVLAWTAQPDTASLVADLRGLAGHGLADAVLDWVTRQAGAAAPPLRQLLRNGQGRQVVPLGLVLGTLLPARAGSRAEDVVLAREALVRLNVLSPVILTKYVVRHMMADGAGRIINMSSIIATTGYNGLSVYGATKAAASGFTRSLAREVGKLGITVNAIAPGFVDTELTQSLSEDQRNRIAGRSSLRRLAEPDDVARMVEYLLGDCGRNVTGSVLTIDAGNTA